jgi:hypothetical protein
MSCSARRLPSQLVAAHRFRASDVLQRNKFKGHVFSLSPNTSEVVSCDTTNLTDKLPQRELDMAARSGLISYDGLPIKSGGAHGLGRLRPAAAWKAFRRFLSNCTTATQPTRVSITINDEPGVDPATIKSLRDSAKTMLRISSRPNQRRDFGEKGTSCSWDIPAGLADAAVDWLAGAGPLAPNWLGGPAKVAVDYEFRVKSPGGEELPFQRSEDYLGQNYDGYGVLLGESGCRLTLESKCALSLVLFLPFEEPDADLWKYARFFQKNMLMSFSKSHWKHWKLSKKGNVYTSHRITPPEL